MIIHFNNTGQLDVPVSDDSYRYRAIRGEHSLTLRYSLPEHVEVPLGAWCDFEGERYTLDSPQNFKKHHTRSFEYTLIMEAAQTKLRKYRFRDTGSRKLKFSLTAKPQEHLQMLVDNLNRREAGWAVGSCIEAVEKAISYNHASCMDALNQLADELETEWEVVGKTVSLRKVEYNKDNPLPLSYGRGNGFKSGVGRTSGAAPVEVLFVQGGERNIDASKYGSAELLLPKSQQIGYDGALFSDQQGYSAAAARKYVTDADGFSLQRSDKPLSSQVEDSLDCSHIYPSRVGTVSSVTVVNASNHFYDFTDSSIPSNLNFADCLTEGETMTVIFQSGILTGKEFEVKYIHAGRRFEMVPQEMDGRTMPDDVFKPAVGDTYAVFGIMMPGAYICENGTKSGASWDMLREAVKHLYENEEQKFTFTGEMDGIWAKKDWLNIGGRIKLGGYVLFSDVQFQPEGVPIRIVGIKDYVNNPHSPTIELSNDVVSGTIVSNLRKIESNEVLTDDLHRSGLQFTKRRFRDAQETTKMLEAAMLTNFTSSVSPLTVQTMQLLAGDENLQYQFVDRIPASNDDAPQRITHEVTYGADKVLRSTFQGRTSGVLQHMTVGITAVKNAHAPTEYSYWALPQFESPPLVEGDKKYYLYAKCSKSAETGVFMLSETAIGMEAVSGYYHFLVALLNSEYDGERSVVTLYGYSEILPGRITTDRIVSTDGKTYFDLVNSEIGGKMTFTNGSSGYSNISDKPDLSPYDEAVNYIDNTLPRVLTRIQAQVDNAIESWFYHYDPEPSSEHWSENSNYPASEWDDEQLKIAHLDDTFTNLDSGQSWRFSQISGTEYGWVLMADSAATKALVLAGQAKDTADGKRRVFVATPTTPYDVGDLWVNGQDLRRCSIARKTGSYVAADWVLATKYDNTKTVIDGGIVTSGTVQLAGSDSAIKAGITGEGAADSSVRIWAGATKENKGSAPFRVMQDGSFVAKDATINGRFIGTLKMFNGDLETINIDNDNQLGGGSINVKNGQLAANISGSAIQVYGGDIGVVITRKGMKIYNGSLEVIGGISVDENNHLTIEGVPASSNGLRSGNIYRSGNYLMIL